MALTVWVRDAVEHTEPVDDTVDERLIEGLVEYVADTVGLRDWLGLVENVGEPVGERDWLCDDVKLPLCVPESEKERDAAPLREGDADEDGQSEGEALAAELRDATSVAFAVRLRDIEAMADCVTDPEEDTDAEALKEGIGVYDSSARSTFTVIGVAGENTGSPS